MNKSPVDGSLLISYLPILVAISRPCFIVPPLCGNKESTERLHTTVSLLKGKYDLGIKQLTWNININREDPNQGNMLPEPLT